MQINKDEIIKKLRGLKLVNPGEKDIRIEIINSLEMTDSLNALISDLKDEPDSYTFDADELETFLFKYNISIA